MPYILVQMQDGVFRPFLLQRFQGKPFEEFLLPLEVGFRFSTTYLFKVCFMNKRHSFSSYSVGQRRSRAKFGKELFRFAFRRLCITFVIL